MAAFGDIFLWAFSFVFVISIVVVIHELGHYWAGRMCGVHAEVFSVGFGPTLLTWRDKQGTVWRVAAAPIGGYVKFLGDAGAASEPDQKKLAEMRKAMGPDADRCFHFKPVIQRAFITAAGPIANFILAISIFAVLLMAFGREYHTPVVGAVLEGSAAEEAGFQVGDRVLRIDGKPMRSNEDISSEVLWRPGQTVRFEIERDGREIEILAAPRLVIREDRFGGERRIGQIGIGARPDQLRHERLDPLRALSGGVEQTWSIISMTSRYVGLIVTGRASPELLNGPIGILDTAGQVAKVSVEQGDNAAESAGLLLRNLIFLAGLLSIGLGLVNLLPIPILDGGHLVYYAYEAVARKPLSAKAQEVGFRVGLALVLGMMLLATWNDLNYQLGRLF